MTRYSDNNRRYKPREDTPIVASYNNTNERREYVCSYCNRTMIKLQDRNSANISYFCNACNIQTNAEETDNLRTRSRLQMPEGVNTTPYASTKFPEPTLDKKKTTIKRNLIHIYFSKNPFIAINLQLHAMIESRTMFRMYPLLSLCYLII
jgi:hypothetical protein